MLHITPWERAALISLARGQSAAQLATAHGVSETEIQHQLTALFAKMGASCTSDAVRAALRRGLIPAGPTPAA